MFKKAVKINFEAGELNGDLVIPQGAKGLVIFAHGSGSSRHSPRNQAVAQYLNQKGLATLLIDLLSPQEELIDNKTGELRFNIPLLADRLVKIIKWASKEPETKELNLGLFGASTGAAAALIAAARLPELVKAVVSRGGRPDLADGVLPEVIAATLLIVGGHDDQVLSLNQFAYEMLETAHKALEIVPGATHLFEEPGALEQVAKLAADWFVNYLLSNDDGL